MVQNAIRTFFKISTQSATRAVRANVNVNYNLHTCSSGISHKNQTLSRVCYFLDFEEDFFDVREVRRCSKLEQRLWILTAIEYRAENREQITRNINPFNRL